MTLYDYDAVRDKFAPVPAMVGVKHEAKVQVLGTVARHAAQYLILEHGDLYFYMLLILGLLLALGFVGVVVTASVCAYIKINSG